MHFLTFVIGDDVDGQLAPYQENNAGDCPEDYLQFFDVEDEYRERFAKERFDRAGLGKFSPARLPKLVRGALMTFDDYMAGAYGPRDERTGRYGDWWNPSSEFDFYEVGGRWSDHLVLRTPRTGFCENPELGAACLGSGLANCATKGDIDFEAMAVEFRKRYLDVWTRLERDGKTADRWAKQKHNIPESIVTHEQLKAYAYRRSQHCAPDAVVVRAEWTGPWWAKDDLTEEAADRWDLCYSSLLASLTDDKLLTVVDCHV